MSDVVDLTVLSLQTKLKVQANRLRQALVQACEAQAAIDEMSADLAGLLQIAKPVVSQDLIGLPSSVGQPQTYATLP